MALLKINNLSVKYGDIVAANDVSFDVEKNERVCILGANGSGKTTILSAIASLISYDGEVLIDGESVKNMPSKRRAENITMLRQMSDIYFSYTVRDTVAMGRYAKIKGAFANLSDTDNAIIDKALTEMGIFDIQNREISTLSGGQLQRVYLARAFAQEPKIILFDEPTNHLDIFYQTELCDKASKWVKNGDRAVIAVFHDISLALSFADKIIFIKDGKIIKMGTVEIAKDEALLYDIFGVSIKEKLENTLKLLS